MKNRAAFVQRYGSGLPVIGQYDGNLSNGGENLLLLEAGRPLLDITYGTQSPWPTAADGEESSLELLDWNGDFNSATNWRASVEVHGTPGIVQGSVLRIQSQWLGGRRVILRFTARAGAGYTVAYKTDLGLLNWVPLVEVPPAPTPGSLEYEDVVPTGVEQRYYRISSP